MKKFFTTKICFFTFLTLVLVAPNFVEAQIVNKIAGAIFSGTTTVLADVIGTLIAPISILVLKIISLATGLAGIILNYVINTTVVGMSANYGGLGVIDSAWSTIRDVANMGFIFVLLYASIQMILGIGKDVRGLIVKMIIAALLINFSLFFTKVVIDASNLLSLPFYNAIVSNETGTGPFDSNDYLSTGLSNALMEPLNLSSIWEMAGGLDPANLATIGVMGSIISLIAAFVFFAIALMFIIRYVVLILVLILSPIAFVSGIIPGLDGAAKQWKDALFNQAFFAPVYMLLTWVTINIFQHLPRASGSLAQALTGTMKTVNGQDHLVYEPDAISLLFTFTVVIVFLVLTLVISKGIANKSGSVVQKITGSALGFAGASTFGLANKIGVRTIGSFGASVAEHEGLQNAAKKDGFGGMAARLALATGKKVSKTSIDLRGVGGLGGILGAGKAETGGYEQDVKNRAKKYEVYKPNEKEINAANTAVEGAKKKLEDARSQAEKDFNLDTDRQADLRAAEEEHRKAQEAALRPKPLAQTAEETRDISTRLEEASARLKAAQEKTAAGRAEFVETSTETERGDHAKTEEDKGALGNRMKDMAKQAERPLGNIFGFNIPRPGGKAKADAIRAAAKAKTNKEKLAEAAEAVAKDDLEEKEKAKKAAEAPSEPESKETK